MKIASFIAGVLLLSGTAARPESWRIGGGGLHHASVIFVDTDSVVRNGNHLRFWADTRMRVPVSLGINKASTLYDADCGDKSFSTVVSKFFAGEVFKTSSGVSSLDYAAPDSLMGQLLDTVCMSSYGDFTVADRDKAAKFFFSIED